MKAAADIRLLKADADTCCALSVLHGAAFAPQEERQWTADEFLELMQTPSIWTYGLYLDQLVAGFLMLQVVAGEAEIITIAMDPKWHGQGYAKHLLNYLHALCLSQGISKVFLEVREDNLKAIKLYSKAGFVKKGVRQGYYQKQKGKPVDALVFALVIDSIGNS
ncbi:ribosomal protein S18-alanine N-acetyltransferase [Kordiimonas pumila]|uniref:Ribosomal protein S18-alanine N-acetyltransferase n=1 Tax=Kordiimonas pumila TaxID=2161677 RepID=A0ABV7D0Q6_9PROT|nr:ribosomal protein S18-alanine N-acetyltransferase [Kordiimonas pumila]